MYKSKVFLVGSNKKDLVPLEETKYVTESVLQQYLCDYPDLLPGDQIDPENPRRWLLVSREMSVPGNVDETGRWSLDHLFLDQDGVPTFVECKRAVDTRARREVVAQMLDYAANGVEYWTMARLRQAAAETAKQQGKNLDEEIARLLDPDDPDIETYWAQVEENLQDRKIRLLFVTDDTPRELRRLVEFLNEELTHVEVLAVEVKQFQGQDKDGHKALVPRVLGLTETARDRKSGHHVTPEEFLEHCRPEIRPFFEQVWALAKARGHTICWGTVGFSIRAHSSLSDRLATFVLAFPSGIFQFYFAELVRYWGVGEDVSSALRAKLLKLGEVKESGAWTLTWKVTGDSMARIGEAYDVILDEVGQLAEGH